MRISTGSASGRTSRGSGSGPEVAEERMGLVGSERDGSLVAVEALDRCVLSYALNLIKY